MKVLIKNFQKMCTPEGKVSKVEFKKVIEAHFGGGDPTLTRMILMTFDKDGNAEIDFREFVLAMAYVMNTNLDNSIDIAFASMDLNGDGGVTRDELRAVFRTQARLHKYINVYKREKNLDEIVLVPSETVVRHSSARKRTHCSAESMN
jgi:Ca2+-binding EF-hand superfamily protein